MRQTMPATTPAAARGLRNVVPVHQFAAKARSGVRTHALTPESVDAVQAALSLQVPTQVSALLQSTSAAVAGPNGAAAAALSGMEPHFGSRAIAGAVQQLAAAAPRLPGVPSLPSLDAAGSAVGGALQPFTTSLPSVSAPSINFSLPSLPSMPSLPSVGAVGDGASLTAAGAALGQNLSAALAGAAGPGGAELARSTAAAAAAAAGAAPGEPLPAHFGSVAFARGVQSLASWVGERFSGLEMIDAATSASLTSALDQLREVAGLMTLPLPPALAAVDVGVGAGGAAAGVSASLQQLGASAAALGAGLRGLAAAGGEAAAAAPEELVASLTAALAQAEANGIGGYSVGQVGVVAALTLLAIAASTPPQGYTGPAAASYSDRDDDDSLSYEYDPDQVAAYFQRRPLAVAQRSAQVAAEAAAFGAALLLDVATGRLQANEEARAEQLRGVIERLGPAYVKVAQALSTRVDLLTPAYFTQIQLLQDRVPPFPCDEAKAEMARAFGGRAPEEVFTALSDKPVAAASLGQVYKATLRPELGGGEVAVKVQRPHVLEQVAMDLMLMRRAAVAMKEAAQMNTDWAALIDAWAVRFFHELDYRREANNAATFAAQMAAAGVSGVTVAPVRRDLSSDCVLVTEWVDGEKLSESGAADVRELCNTLLNAYLIQLLDTGFLHADPHPGNLIRTPDGRICVLDFGLMTEVTAEQRIALVEYIAHLSTRDWGKLALDLQTLGFIPPEVDTQEAGLVEPLGRVMVQLVGGGGASKVNIDKVMSDLEALGDSYPITIPPFFALILRAFSVIEGIALRVDPDYAIVGECFPYLARRLLNDDSPRMRAVLRDVLYGGRQRLDVERLMRVADGLSSFTTDGLAAGGGAAAAAAPAPAAAGRSSLARAMAAATAGPGAAASSGAAAGSAALAPRVGSRGVVEVVAVEEEGAVLSPAMVDTLRSVLRPGSYVSELLVDELVAAVDALSRDSLSQVVRTLLASGPAAASLRRVEALGPLRSVLLPLPTPVEVLAWMAPAVAVTPEDQEALAVVRAILTLSQRMAAVDRAAAASGAGGLPAPSAAALARGVQPRRAARLASELGTLLPELTPGLAYTSDLFVRALVRRVTVRIGEAATLAVSGRPAAGGGLVGGGMMGGGAGGAVAPQPAGAIAMRNMMAPPSSQQRPGQVQGPAQQQQRRPGQPGGMGPAGAQGGRR